MQTLATIAVALVVGLAGIRGCTLERSVKTARGLRGEVIARGLELPTHLTAPASDPRLFVTEQSGRIRIIRDGQVLDRPFLDLRDSVSFGGERGLFSIAFHPRYRQNGFFFVSYTDKRGDTRIERYTVSRDPDVADPSTCARVFAIHQPYDNHNGGLVQFGPDGKFYIGMGDGGLGGDPHRNGQNRSVLLAKLLRVDVDHGLPYTIPPDNPYVGHPAFRPEIWAYGLRNPWRFSFDPEGKFLYIADDGEWRWEEVDIAPAKRKGVNYGWCDLEGMHCLRGERCKRWGSHYPIVEYSHRIGCTIIGGAVYRGHGAPALRGHYLFSDHCSGWVRSFRYDGGRMRDYREWPELRRPSVSSFGEGANGELYILTLDGVVRRIVAKS